MQNDVLYFQHTFLCYITLLYLIYYLSVMFRADQLESQQVSVRDHSVNSASFRYFIGLD